MNTRVDEPPPEGRLADLDFYFDPVCPFAWMTSKWVRLVAEQRDYEVDWRFISLRMINAHIDYGAHFGPVISRLPHPDEAGPLWDHVLGLANFRGFAELKRSLRERPQLASFGVDPTAPGIEEDWHGGSRRVTT